MTGAVDVLLANGILITVDDLDPRFIDHRESPWPLHQS
jgi:hypothetical protein